MHSFIRVATYPSNAPTTSYIQFSPLIFGTEARILYTESYMHGNIILRSMLRFVAPRVWWKFIFAKSGDSWDLSSLLNISVLFTDSRINITLIRICFPKVHALLKPLQK